MESRGGEEEIEIPHEPRHARHLQPEASGKRAQRQSFNGDPQKCRGNLTEKLIFQVHNNKFKFQIRMTLFAFKK